MSPSYRIPESIEIYLKKLPPEVRTSIVKVLNALSMNRIEAKKKYNAIKIDHEKQRHMVFLPYGYFMIVVFELDYCFVAAIGESHT